VSNLESALGIPDLARMRPAVAAIPTWGQVAHILSDLLFLVTNFYFISYFVTRWPLSSLVTVKGSYFGLPAVLHAEFLRILFLFSILTLLLLNLGNVYRLPRTNSILRDCRTVVWATLIATVLVTEFNYISGLLAFPETTIVLTGLLNVLALTGWRLLKHILDGRRTCEDGRTRNVLIVGAGRTGRRLAQFLEQNTQLGYKFRGFLDKHDRSDNRVLGKIEHLPQVARAHFIDEVIITSLDQREQLTRVVSMARRHRLDVKVVPGFYDDLSDEQHRTVPIEYVGGYPVLTLHRQPIPALGFIVKRALDIVLAVLGLVVLAPLMLAIAVAIKVDSRGPVLYFSRRLGKKGRSFTFFKFRTMVVGSDVLKNQLRNCNERRGPCFKLADDPRITRVGRFLRKYSLDELPQLWNVLKGDMSMVGPRPHPLDDCERYRLDHLRRLDVTPGITGLWQITSRRDPSFDKNMVLDLQYIENWSLWQDVTILLKTIPALLRAEGQ
jgi:exopolysaccharide biosynthesis polyprenyl glycosylphosphotransferase